MGLKAGGLIDFLGEHKVPLAILGGLGLAGAGLYAYQNRPSEYSAIATPGGGGIDPATDHEIYKERVRLQREQERLEKQLALNQVYQQSLGE